MPIPADQATNIVASFKRALDVFYGSSVATLKQFQDQKRKTFMEKLEAELDAPSWRKKVADKVAELGTARGVVTQLGNNKQVKQVELGAKHAQELADLKARQAAEMTKLVAHYEPDILAATENKETKEKELEQARREAYFHGIKQEDDGRSFYRDQDLGVDKAIRETVDSFIENNLEGDPDGAKVLARIKQEDLVKELVYFEKNVETMRASFLRFIESGDLPPVTILGWKIVKGKDITVK